MADARDSKSRDRKIMRVRLPPPAPAFARSVAAGLRLGMPDQHHRVNTINGGNPDFT